MIIFNTNTTILGESTIPMAEGYDCSTGTALALIDSARNDFAMFEAMLKVEAKELHIMNSYNGVMRESNIQALAENAISGLWSKIKELIAKVVAKIKAIFVSFMKRVDVLFMDDKKLIKKYGVQVKRKSGIENLEVQWREVDHDPFDFNIADGVMALKAIIGNKNINELPNYDNSEDRMNYFAKELKIGISDADDIKQDVMDYCFKDDTPSPTELKSIGGISGIITYLENYKDKFKKLDKNIKDFATHSEKTIKDIDKLVDDIVKKQDKEPGTVFTSAKNAAGNNLGGGMDYTTRTSENIKSGHVTTAKIIFDLATAWQAVTLQFNQAVLDCVAVDYKQHKAAFAKAITVSEKKLSESVISDFFVEAAEDEVDEVIEKAIDGNEVDTFEDSKASEKVLDAGVSNDPDKNDADYVEKAEDGYDEAAFFATRLY